MAFGKKGLKRTGDAYAADATAAALAATILGLASVACTGPEPARGILVVTLIEAYIVIGGGVAALSRAGPVSLGALAGPAAEALSEEQVVSELRTYVERLVREDAFSGTVLLDGGAPPFIQEFGGALEGTPRTVGALGLLPRPRRVAGSGGLAGERRDGRSTLAAHPIAGGDLPGGE